MYDPKKDPAEPPITKPQPDGTYASAEEPTADDRLWALLAHLSGLLFGVFGPLIIWLVKKEESAFIEDQAKEALNFQLSVMIVGLVCAGTCVLIPLAVVIVIGSVVYAILAAVESQKGVRYRYPYTFRLVN